MRVDVGYFESLFKCILKGFANNWTLWKNWWAIICSIEINCSAWPTAYQITFPIKIVTGFFSGIKAFKIYNPIKAIL